MIVEDDSIEIEKIVSHRFLSSKLEYRVKFKGYQMLEWTPANYFRSNKCDFLDKYNKANNIIFDGDNSKVMPKLNIKNEKIIQNQPSSKSNANASASKSKALLNPKQEIKTEEHVRVFDSQSKFSATVMSPPLKATGRKFIESSIDSSLYSAESLSEYTTDADMNSKEDGIKTTHSSKPSVPKSFNNELMQSKCQSTPGQANVKKKTTHSSKVSHLESDGTKSIIGKPSDSIVTPMIRKERTHSSKISLLGSVTAKPVMSKVQDCHTKPNSHNKVKLSSKLFMHEGSVTNSINSKLHGHRMKPFVPSETSHLSKPSMPKNGSNKSVDRRPQDLSMKPIIKKKRSFSPFLRSDSSRSVVTESRECSIVRRETAHLSKPSMPKNDSNKFVEGSPQDLSMKPIIKKKRSFSPLLGSDSTRSVANEPRESSMKSMVRRETIHETEISLLDSDSPKSVSRKLQDSPMKSIIRKKIKHSSRIFRSESHGTQESTGKHNHHIKPSFYSDTTHSSRLSLSKRDNSKSTEINLHNDSMKPIVDKKRSHSSTLSLPKRDGTESNETKPQQIDQKRGTEISNTSRLFRDGTKSIKSFDINDHKTQIIHKKRPHLTQLFPSDCDSTKSTENKLQDFPTKLSVQKIRTDVSKSESGIILKDCYVQLDLRRELSHSSIRSLPESKSTITNDIRRNENPLNEIDQKKTKHSSKVYSQESDDTKSVESKTRDCHVNTIVQKHTKHSSKLSSHEIGETKSVVNKVQDCSLKPIMQKRHSSNASLLESDDSKSIERKLRDNPVNAIVQKHTKHSSKISSHESDDNKSTERKLRDNPVNAMVQKNTKHSSKLPLHEIGETKSVESKVQDCSLKPIMRKRHHSSNASLLESDDNKSIERKLRDNLVNSIVHKKTKHSSKVSCQESDDTKSVESKTRDCHVNTIVQKNTKHSSKLSSHEIGETKSVVNKDQDCSLKPIMRKIHHSSNASLLESDDSKSIESKLRDNPVNAIVQKHTKHSSKISSHEIGETKSVESKVQDGSLKPIMRKRRHSSNASLLEIDDNKVVESSTDDYNITPIVHDKTTHSSKHSLPECDSIKSTKDKIKPVLQLKRTRSSTVSLSESDDSKLIEACLQDCPMKQIALENITYSSNLSLPESDITKYGEAELLDHDSNSLSPLNKRIKINTDNNARVSNIETNSKYVETPITIDVLLPIIATNNKRVFDHILRIYDRGVLCEIVKGNPCLLVLAAINDSLIIVNTLLGLGANVNGTDYAGTTALIAACNNGNETMLDLLIKRGADVNIVTNGKNKVLEKCIMSNNLRLFKRVLSAKADYSSIEHLIEDKSSELALILDEHKQRILEPLNIRIRSSHVQFYKNIVERMSLHHDIKIVYPDQTTIPSNLKINRLARKMILFSCISPKSFTIEQILGEPLLFSFEIHVAQNEGQLVADYNGKRLVTTLNTMNTYYINKDEASMWKFSLRPNRDPSTFAFIFALELYMTGGSDENKSTVQQRKKDYGYLYNPTEEDYNLRRSFIRIPLSIEEIRSRLVFICVDLRETVRWTQAPVQIAILNYDGMVLLDTLICPRERLRKTTNIGFGAKDDDLLGAMDELKAKDIIREITCGKIIVSHTVKKLINNLNIDKDLICGIRDVSSAIAVRKVTQDVDEFMDLKNIANKCLIFDEFLSPLIVATVIQRIYKTVEWHWEDDIVVNADIESENRFVENVRDFDSQCLLSGEAMVVTDCEYGAINTGIVSGIDFNIDDLLDFF